MDFPAIRNKVHAVLIVVTAELTGEEPGYYPQSPSPRLHLSALLWGNLVSPM